MELILVQTTMPDDAGSIRAFQFAHDILLERFYKENYEIITYQQYKEAKNNVDYFMGLILLASQYYKDESAGEKVLH